MEGSRESLNALKSWPSLQDLSPELWRRLRGRLLRMREVAEDVERFVVEDGSHLRHLCESIATDMLAILSFDSETIPVSAAVLGTTLPWDIVAPYAPSSFSEPTLAAIFLIEPARHADWREISNWLKRCSAGLISAVNRAFESDEAEVAVLNVLAAHAICARLMSVALVRGMIHKMGD